MLHPTLISAASDSNSESLIFCSKYENGKAKTDEIEKFSLFSFLDHTEFGAKS